MPLIVPPSMEVGLTVFASLLEYLILWEAVSSVNHPRPQTKRRGKLDELGFEVDEQRDLQRAEVSAVAGGLCLSKGVFWKCHGMIMCWEKRCKMNRFYMPDLARYSLSIQLMVSLI